MKELQIKTLLIEHLLKQPNDAIFGVEVPFQFGSRRADVVSITKNIAVAYEIKGANDSIDRLEYQIKSYKSYFDYCFIVCEHSNLNSIRKSISNDIGILVVHDDAILHVRKSKLFKKHSKQYLASTLPVSKLRKIVKDRSLRSKSELCEAAANELSMQSIHQLSRNNLREKYQIQTTLLRRDVLVKVTPDDILTISRSPPHLLKL